MKTEEAKDLTWELVMTCDINQRYHQRLTWRWKVADKAAKIAVALTASLAFAAAFFDHDLKTLERWLAALALVVAVLLNVTPFGEYEKFYERMFLGWSKLRRCADSFSLKLEDVGEETVPVFLAEKFLEMKNEMNLLHSEEPAPWRPLLIRCQEESNESVYGEGCRTVQDIEVKKREQSPTSGQTTSAS